MAKPGIFDPWRQEAEPPPAPEVAAEQEQDPNQHCVRFKGVRYGIHVWLPGEWEDAAAQAAAQDRLKTVMRECGLDLSKAPAHPRQSVDWLASALRQTTFRTVAARHGVTAFAV